MITAKITKGADLGKKFRDSIPNMQSGVQKEIMRLALKMTLLIQTKLSGDVLNVRSGRLRRSIHPEWDFIPGIYRAAVGTNVEYAGIHEYGGIIKAKERIQKMYYKIGRDGMVGSQFVKKSKSNFVQEAKRKAHDIHMPERSFLRSALREMNPEIVTGIMGAVAKELNAIKR
jgi:phage gpG-like protein